MKTYFITFTIIDGNKIINQMAFPCAEKLTRMAIEGWIDVIAYNTNTHPINVQINFIKQLDE